MIFALQVNAHFHRQISAEPGKSENPDEKHEEEQVMAPKTEVVVLDVKTDSA